MQAGEEVLCLDNTFTGRKANVRQWWDHPRFEFIRHDVTEPIKLEVDRIWHLACPASPIHYQTNPVKTAKTSFLGSHLVDRLMQAGEEVLCLDNTFSGRKANLRQWWDHPRFEFIRHDVTDAIKLEVDRI